MIAARLTANIPAGIATIAVRGSHAASTVLKLACLRTRHLEQGRIHYGHWPIRSINSQAALAGRKSAAEVSQTEGNRDDGRQVLGDEQVVVCRTRVDQVEIHCHGGSAVCDGILASLQAAGCDVIHAEEWPSDQTSPIAQAAEANLLRTRTDRAAAVFFDQIDGALSNALRDIADDLLGETPQDRQRALEGVQRLLRHANFGRRLTSGWKVVLAGPPNVGKSSLINSIVGQTRSIVHATAGTTRDWIDAETVILGWPISITDTAGIREAQDSIEQQGIERALERVKVADLLVLVVDITVGWTHTHEVLREASDAPKLICVTKADLQADWFSAAKLSRLRISELDSAQTGLSSSVVFASTAGEPGCDALIQAIGRQLFENAPPPGAAVPFTDLQQEALSRALELAQRGDTATAAQVLHQLDSPVGH